MMDSKGKKPNQNTVNNLGLGEIVRYFFRKKDPDRPTSFNLKMMHGINKISILMFLMAVIVMIIRYFVRH